MLFASVGPLGRGGVVGGCLTSGSVVGGACFGEGVCLCGLCPFWNSFFCLASGLRRDGDGEVAVLVDRLRLSVSWIVKPPWVRKSSSSSGAGWSVRTEAYVDGVVGD